MLKIFKPRENGAYLTYIPGQKKSLEEIRECIAHRKMIGRNYALFPHASISEEDIKTLEAEGRKVETGVLFGKECFQISW